MRFPFQLTIVGCLLSLIRTEDSYDHLPNLETITVEDNVYVLDDSNYDSFVQQHPVALVEFYAPWCGHCQALAPEYSKAAKILQNDLDEHTNKVALAKVDASKFIEFSRKHDVSGYPTLFVYQNGTKSEYDGPRTAQGIVDYMKEIANPNYKPPDEAVITLTHEDFDKIINAEPLILVEFYAPWCGHCKRLKPEYERAARRLKEIEKPIKMAKIDATVEERLAKRFDVRGYPTLFIFRNGKKTVYKGPRDENGIVDYMKQMQSIPSVKVESKEQLRKQIKDDIPTVVGLFDSEPDQRIFDIFTDVAYDQFDEENHFVHVTDTDLVKQLKQEPNTLILFIPLWFRSKYEPNSHVLHLEPTSSVETIVNFLGNNSIPLVGYRNSRSYSLYSNRFPIVVVYYDVDFSFEHRKQTQMIREQVLKAASQIKKTEDITFVIANENDNQQELKDLKLDDSGEDVNVGYYESHKKRYAMEPTDEFNDKVLIDFVLAIRTGKIKPIIRSQFIPDHNPIGNLWTVVGDTFEQLVSSKTIQYDIMLEFYAPWCGHCKSLEPIYKELAKKFEPQKDHVRIMKLDATTNDFPEWFDVSGFPTLYYIRAGDPFNPIAYKGERKLEDLIKFIQDQLELRKNTKDEL